MARQHKIKILLSFVLFAAGIVFFSLAVQKYQVLTQSRAAGGDRIDIVFSPSEKHGKVEQSYGLILTNLTNDTEVTELISLYKNKNVFLKINNPTPETISTANFAKLSSEGFKWAFTFPDYTTIDNVLDAYYATYDGVVIVELTDLSKVNKQSTEALLAVYPDMKFQAANFAEWPREPVKQLTEMIPAGTLDSVSFRAVGDANQPVFDDIKLWFATFYDASNDEPGMTNISINWPANSKLALSNIEITGHTLQEQARRYGFISSAIVSSVQTQNKSGKAAIKYITAGEYSPMSAEEKRIIALFAEFIKRQPEIVWPYAIPQNGDPWYNTVFDKSNTEPLIGVIGLEGTSYMGIILNSKNESVVAELPSGIDLSTYSAYSNQRGFGDHIGDDRTITFQPYETVVFYTGTAPIPTLTPSTSPTAGGPTTPPNVPTLPPIPTQAVGALICDPGPDPYNSNFIIVYNDSNERIEELNTFVHRCTYEPGRLANAIGSYKCEGQGDCTPGDPGDVNCQEGLNDPATNLDFPLNPKETRVLTMTVNACEIAQLDVQNHFQHVDDSVLECTNIRSQHTVDIGKRWLGGIAFAIQENSTGYVNGSCEVTPTPTPTATTVPDTPTPTPSDTPTPPPPDTPTPTPTATPTDTPTPTVTPIPTNTLIPTNTPIPTNTLIPTNPPPIQNIAVNEQPPGMTPWVLITVPIGLILLGLFL